MLADFKNYFAVGLSSKFPASLMYVAESNSERSFKIGQHFSKL